MNKCSIERRKIYVRNVISILVAYVLELGSMLAY
jgi:hypothetical protein